MLANSCISFLVDDSSTIYPGIVEVDLFGAKGDLIALNLNKNLKINFCLVSDTQTNFHRILLRDKVGDVHVVRAALKLPNLEMYTHT